MKKIKFRDLIKENILNEAGEAAGKMELVSTSLEDARKFIESKGLNLDKDLPNFDSNYKVAQKRVGIGRTKRNQMPVIDDKDIKQFQSRLTKGYIDIKEPFSPTFDKNDPFPEGLKGTRAQDFLIRGLKDKNKKDDIIGVTITNKKASDLKPIQKQIYYDKSAEATAKNGIKGTTDFLTKRSFFITSKDNYIIDGHHRFLSAMLIDPNMKINALSIDLPVKDLLPLSRAYGDSVGNERNS